MKLSLNSLSRTPAAAVTRRRLPAWMIPAGIVAGFALLFLFLFQDRLLPAQDVKVAVVLAGLEEATTRSAEPAGFTADGPMAFQASGWVEPDPLPIKATALVDGVIDEVHILEGEEVEKDQPLATLVRADFELALKSHQQALRTRESELVAHRESILAAEQSIAVARAELEAAQALVEETADRDQRVGALASGTISQSEIVTIQSAFRQARAGESAARAAVGQAEAEVKRLKANIIVLESAIAAAKVDIEIAELALSRTRITAPMSGRVLRLVAAPGQKKMLAMDDPDSATVAILYDPEHLQVRVDVPLADAAGLQIGQKARIRCSLLPDRVFHGEVTRITGEADVQRNTLQAKVRIVDPSDQLRPEMLCRVEFLETGTAPTSAAGFLTTWIPQAAIDGNTVWICNPDSKRVEPRTVRTGNETQDGFVRINEGLRPGEWVVLSPSGLEAGQRVNPERTEP